MHHTLVTALLTLTLAHPAAAQATTGQDEVTEVIAALERSYYKPVDRAALQRAGAGGVAGVLGALQDPSTFYVSPDDAALTAERGTSHGLQLQAAHPDGTGATVASVTRFSPAWRGGVQPGDTIGAIGGQAVGVLPLHDIEQLLPTRVGQTVQVELRRGGTERQVVLRREVPSAVLVDRSGLPEGTAYLSVSTLGVPDIGGEVARALAPLRAARVDRLVLDLRDNPGGLLSEVVKVADQFLRSGTVVGLRTRDGKEQIEGRATRSGSDYTGRIVVLVNGHTASGAEVLASVLQGAGATVVGEKTAGKAVAALVVPLRNGGRLVLSHAVLFTPAGDLHGRGVTPDLPVQDNRVLPPAGATVNPVRDQVLRRALQDLGRSPAAR